MATDQSHLCNMGIKNKKVDVGEEDFGSYIPCHNVRVKRRAISEGETSEYSPALTGAHGLRQQTLFKLLFVRELISESHSQLVKY